MARWEYPITIHDAAQFTDDEISMETSLFHTIEGEVWPEDPVTPFEDAIAAARAVPSRVRRTAFRAWEPDGTLAGSVQLSIDPERDDNPDVLGCPIQVRLDHRRRGVGAALLGHVIAFAQAEGRTRLVGHTYSHPRQVSLKGIPGEQLLWPLLAG